MNNEEKALIRQLEVDLATGPVRAGELIDQRQVQLTRLEAAGQISQGLVGLGHALIGYFAERQRLAQRTRQIELETKVVLKRMSMDHKLQMLKAEHLARQSEACMEILKMDIMRNSELSQLQEKLLEQLKEINTNMMDI